MVEVLANLATVIVALLLSAVLVKEFLLPRPHPVSQTEALQTAKGTNLKGVLPDVDWAKNGRTLILAVSTQCHFCVDSLPFLQRVAKEAGCHVKLLALLPQNKTAAEAFLSKGGVRVDDVRQVALDSIGVRGTPMLLLVDEAGTVTDTWKGKLAPDQEGQVLAALKDLDEGKK
jgi:thiol-disulfide isomerase/thioredoxin